MVFRANTNSFARRQIQRALSHIRLHLVYVRLPVEGLRRRRHGVVLWVEYKEDKKREEKCRELELMVRRPCPNCRLGTADEAGLKQVRPP